MQAMYRVTCGEIYNHAPTTLHMGKLPCPDQDELPLHWSETHPHCAALENTLHDWWPAEVVKSKCSENWGFFKIIPTIESAALIGRTQAVFNPEHCDIIRLTREEFLDLTR